MHEYSLLAKFSSLDDNFTSPSYLDLNNMSYLIVKW